MISTKKRKIAVLVTHRAPYGRLRPVLRAIQQHSKLELQIVAGTPKLFHSLFFALRHGAPVSLSASLPWYLRARARAIFNRTRTLERLDHLVRLIRGDGFPVHAYLPFFLEGGNLETMTKSVGSGLLGLPEIFKKLKPDIVLVHADRFEMLPAAIAASMMNIPLAHTQGGDVTGTVDETVRHTITKLAHIHFPTTRKSKERLIRMGEDPRHVFMVGCPTIDHLKNIDLNVDGEIWQRNRGGHGDKIDFTKPYLLVLQHPVTTEYGAAKKNMEETIAAVQTLNMPTLFFAPNIDAGQDGAAAAVREFLKHHSLPALALYKSFNPDDFYRVLNHAAVAVGNSSSFIREGAYLGTPAVIVGTRQNGRERGENVVEAGYDKNEIIAAVRKQIAHGKYSSGALFGDGTASARIADILADVDPPVQKQFFEA